MRPRQATGTGYFRCVHHELTFDPDGGGRCLSIKLARFVEDLYCLGISTPAPQDQPGAFLDLDHAVCETMISNELRFPAVRHEHNVCTTGNRNGLADLGVV